MASIEAVGAREILDSRGNPTVEVEVAPRRRRVRPGRGAQRRLHRRVRGGRAARRRRALRRQGRRRRPSTASSRRSPRRSRASTPTTSGSSTRRCSTSTARPTRPSSAPTRSSASRSPSPAPPPTRAGLPLFRYVGGPNAHLLPVPMMNILNGGSHADSNVDVQEFMIAPIGAPTFREALRQGAEVYHALKSVLKKKGLATGLGDEGGFAPDLRHQPRRARPDRRGRRGRRPQAGQRHRARARRRAPASSTTTAPTPSRASKKSADEMTAYYADLVASYPIVSIEDPLDEDDWDGWKAITDQLGDQDPDRRRRPVRHQRRAPPARHQRAARPTRCWSRSTRSARSPRPSTPSTSRTATASAA